MKLSEDCEEEKSPNSSPLLLVSGDEDDHVLDGGDDGDEGEHAKMYMNKYGYEKNLNSSPLLLVSGDDE